MEAITHYNSKTPKTVQDTLEWARINRKRIRIYYGDTKTGRDWCEFYGTTGYVGRSCGDVKIPIMLLNSRSNGGIPILDHCIVKITCDHHTYYQHPTYHMPLRLEGNQIVDERGMCYFRNEDKARVIREYKWFTGHYDRH